MFGLPGVQWLGLKSSTAGGMDSVPPQGTKIPHATQYRQKFKKKKMKFSSQLSVFLSLKTNSLCANSTIKLKTSFRSQGSKIAY